MRICTECIYGDHRKMSEFTEINEAWWDWYYQDGRNKTGKQRKEFFREREAGLHPFIYKDKKTGLVSITIEHISPIFAKDFLTLIIKEANTLKRKKDIDTSNKALIYLKEELSQTRFVEIKDSINQLINSDDIEG